MCQNNDNPKALPQIHCVKVKKYGVSHDKIVPNSYGTHLRSVSI